MRVLPSFHITSRFISVWRRHLTVYEKSWKISFIPPLLEPLFYLLAFGIGLSALVGNVHYRGAAVPYVEFIAPALIAISIMYNAFFETTYSSYVRMYYQKTFNAMIATPLSLEEIITGEIVWGATKSIIAAAIMLTVISAFGLISYPAGLLLLPLALLGGLAFGSIGMFFTGLVPNIDAFNLPIFLFITPMFLFGGTFFPDRDAPPLGAEAGYDPSPHLAGRSGPRRGLGGLLLHPGLGGNRTGRLYRDPFPGGRSLLCTEG